jgi:U4/U6 small nuclear ribonucleoprotein PRP31
MTEVRKFHNRLKFGLEAEEEFRNTGVGMGMLSQGIGKVKLHVNK